VNDVYAQTIAAGMADLQRIVPTPEEPLKYGVDLSCTTEIPETLEMVALDSPRAISEAVFRRWITPRGALPGDADYGLDVRAILNHGMTSAEILAMGAQMQAEAEKDDRVSRCSVTITKVDARGSRWVIRTIITPENPDLNDFEMTMAVTDGEALLEAIAA
jgi:hypothetical protein